MTKAHMDRFEKNLSNIALHQAKTGKQKEKSSDCKIIIKNRLRCVFGSFFPLHLMKSLLKRIRIEQNKLFDYSLEAKLYSH